MKSVKGLLKSDKSKKLILILLAILGLILIFLPTAIQEKSSSTQDYTKELEEKLKNVLESVTGKDTIEVMITFESVYENKPVQTGLFSSDESSKNDPLPKIAGAMIVCKGISDTGDFDIIKRAAATALGTDQNKIYIIGGANKQ